ncbi:MAG: hypothetical protein V9F06_01555 [Thermomicrobiales bacterium]
MTGPLIPRDDRGATAFPVDTTRLVVVVEGGTVDDSSVVHAPSELLAVGERILLGLVATRSNRADVAFEPLVQTASGPVWWGVERFILGDDGSATYYDRSFSAREVVGGILDALAWESGATPGP